MSCKLRRRTAEADGPPEEPDCCAPILGDILWEPVEFAKRTPRFEHFLPEELGAEPEDPPMSVLRGGTRSLAAAIPELADALSNDACAEGPASREAPASTFPEVLLEEPAPMPVASTALP